MHPINAEYIRQLEEQIQKQATTLEQAQAVIEQMREKSEAGNCKAKPVAWTYTINNSHSIFSTEKPPEDAYDEGTLYPLYAAPVVQPNMVMVPRKITAKMNEAAWSEMAGGDITSTEELQRAFDAMIAAAERSHEP